MKVSIIVAAYNVQEYIEKCLNSLINQTLKDIEIIIVNDGSTDNTREKVEKIALNDKRVKLINKKNEGLIEARKSGLQESNGEYIMFVDGDDWIRNDSCEMLYNKASKLNLDIVYFNLIFSCGKRIKHCDIYDFGVVEGEEYLKLVLTNSIRANAVLQFIRRSFLIENKIKFLSDITYAEDLAITVSIAINNPKAGCINQPLYYYYQRPDSITKLVDERIFDIEKVINIIERELLDNCLMNKYKDEFYFLTYLHLFYYRIVDVDKIEEIHMEIFRRWKKRNLIIEDNKYYKEFLKNVSISNKVKIKLYNISFQYGKIYTNMINNIYHKPKYLMKKILIRAKII